MRRIPMSYTRRSDYDSKIKILFLASCDFLLNSKICGEALVLIKVFNYCCKVKEFLIIETTVFEI